MKKIVIITVAFIFILLGCKKEDTDPSVGSMTSVSPIQIVPHKIGNSWNLRTINFAGNDTTYFTNSILKDTLVGLEIWYVEQFGNAASSVPTKNMNDGLYFYHSSIHLGELAYKYPAQVNEGYYSSYYNDSIIVLSINSTVTVPAGTFNCYQYFTYRLWGTYTGYIYVSPGIGFVKSESYVNNVLSSNVELISYHLN